MTMTMTNTNTKTMTKTNTLRAPSKSDPSDLRHLIKEMRRHDDDNDKHEDKDNDKDKYIESTFKERS